MRARNIKPGFFKNEILGSEDPLLSILFIGLWCLADRDGLLEDRPKRIKAEIFPYRDCDVNGYLTQLERLGFVKRTVTLGIPLISIKNFKKHQSPHHTEKKSNWSQCSLELDSCEVTVKSPLDLRGNPPDSLIPDSLIPNTGDSYINTVIEYTAPTVSSPLNLIPDNLHPMNYAAKIIQDLQMPHTPMNIRSIAAAIEAEHKAGKPLPSAYEFVLAGALDARDHGISVDKFLFEDQKYKSENRRNGNGSKRTQALDRIGREGSC